MGKIFRLLRKIWPAVALAVSFVFLVGDPNRKPLSVGIYSFETYPPVFSVDKSRSDLANAKYYFLGAPL